MRRAVSSPRVRPGATARPAVAAALLHGARHPRPASCRLHLRHHSQCSALGTGGAGRRRAGRAGPAQGHSSRAALPSLGRDPPGRAGAAGPDGRAARRGGRPAAARRRNLRADPRAEVQSGAESTVVTEHGDVKAEHVVLATGMPIPDRAGYFARLEPGAEGHDHDCVHRPHGPRRSDDQVRAHIRTTS